MKILRTYIVLMMIPLMVLSTGGFNIFTHLCHSTGEKLISFQEPGFCKMEKFDCCGRPVAVNNLKTASCCENHHIFIRTINDVFNVYYKPVLHHQTTLIIPFLKLVYEELCPVVDHEYLYSDFTSPPEHTSKFLLIKYGQLKLDC